MNPEINQPQVILNKESNRTKIVPDKKYKLEDSDLIAKNLLKKPNKQEELQNGENRPPRVVPLNIEAPKEMSGSIIPEEKEDAAHYVPVSQVSGPAHDFYQTVKNMGALEKNNVVDALATMVAVQELKFTDIYAEDEEYTVKVDEQLFQKRQAELKKDKLIAEIADGLLMNNGQHAKQLIIASEQSARGTAREEDMSKDAEENARIYVNRMYQKLLNQYKQQDAPEEDAKEAGEAAENGKIEEKENQLDNKAGQEGVKKGLNP
ncbi:MAG: hypothetical protein J6P72_06480 [Firmicutes bacterium]|nr:hypothetical protein [Bacillota bacterium]